jgi:hypothetical protein
MKDPRAAYRHITRIDDDHAHTHGWRVRFQTSGDLQTRLFSDRKHGGKSGALKAARRWRDENKKPAKNSKPTGGTARIYLATIKGKKLWRAILPVADVTKTKSFAVHLYGRDEAKRRAEAWLELNREGIPS